jgi:ribosomal protein S18 acetylase RimI-like enzyme
MDIRPATESDSDTIREVAEQSFRTSYALSPEEIEAIIDVEFGTDALAERLDEDSVLLYVAEDDEAVIGFVEAQVTEGEGRLVWLHVAPPSRGQGAGTELFERATAELRDRTSDRIRAVVLSEDQEGGEFFEQFEFEEGDTGEVDIGGTTFRVEYYTDEPGESQGEESVVPDDEITVDGQRRYVDHEETIPGDEEPFLVVFEDEDRENQYGFYCTNCGTFTDSIDSLGKIVCDTCGNVHRPDEWDRSYL